MNSLFNRADWERKELNKVPVYFNRLQPDWFVPNTRGDQILQNKSASEFRSIEAERFLAMLPPTTDREYLGRAAYLKLESLKEVWFHVTNRCNLACSHCMFSSSPEEEAELPYSQLKKLSDEAYDLGCRLFVLTGGEPLIHRERRDILRHFQDYGDVDLVMLTNGLNLQRTLDLESLLSGFIHLQISVDGLEENHDAIRGKGVFSAVQHNLRWLQSHKVPYTISMCVTCDTMSEMPRMIEFAANHGATNVHFMWYFIRGKGESLSVPVIHDLSEKMKEAHSIAQKLSLSIDNIENLKTQIFAPRGTIHDGTTAGWESLAIGPDGVLYPSAALVGIPELGTSVAHGLERAWKESPTLKKIRDTTIRSIDSPYRFYLAGGDTDQSYINNKTFMNNDPYAPLNEELLTWLIVKEAGPSADSEGPGITLRMGDVLVSCGAHGRVALAHSNCLLATAENESLTTIKTFYTEATGDTKEDILNPVCFDEEYISHIPDEFRFRGYGCGSPVLDAEIQSGETVCDLGCGSGVECFIAAKLVGPQGKVVGIDMLDSMLTKAEEAKEAVAKNLVYRNVTFRKSYLEALPLEDSSVDVILSNCVMNLSVHKRKAYAEIFRVLKPGGRLVISDVICETEPDPAIRNDETLRGECIAGAFTQSHLINVLENTGFQSIRFLKRFPYRKVRDHQFYSLTYTACKASESELVKVMFPGPAKGLQLNDGSWLFPGVPRLIEKKEAEILGEAVYIIDEQGHITNSDRNMTCSCALDPATTEKPKQLPDKTTQRSQKYKTGCLVCGEELIYPEETRKLTCSLCRKTFTASNWCHQGHYVCDNCHAEDALNIIELVCRNSQEKDMAKLFQMIQRHPAIPLHGPEYHSLVPAVIITAYKNAGGEVTGDALTRAIQRGNTVSGGSCAFWGACGAATGVGIAFSIILGANPIKPEERQNIMRITQSVIKEIAQYKAARCCYRDCLIALKKAAELSGTFLEHTVHFRTHISCHQHRYNKECLGSDCPFCKTHKIHIEKTAI